MRCRHRPSVGHCFAAILDGGRAKGQGAVGTAEQIPANQIREIEAAGFEIEPSR
jgi:hypothetical protein